MEDGAWVIQATEAVEVEEAAEAGGDNKEEGRAERMTQTGHKQVLSHSTGPTCKKIREKSQRRRRSS